MIGTQRNWLKIGKTLIRLDALDYINVVADDHLVLLFSDGQQLTLRGDEAATFGAFLKNQTQNGQVIDVMKTARPEAGSEVRA